MSELTIRQAATLAGCTPVDLRNWGERYGWPNPHRTKTGARRFSLPVVRLLRDVVAETARGTPVGQILGTGFPVFPRRGEEVQPRSFDAVSLAGLPEPTRADGVELRGVLLVALGRGGDAASLRRMAESALPRVHPTDRPAILALLARVEQAPSSAT